MWKPPSTPPFIGVGNIDCYEVVERKETAAEMMIAFYWSFEFFFPFLFMCVLLRKRAKGEGSFVNFG
jgi:hypothetical protein